MRVERVASVFEHFLGEIAANNMCLDAEVAEHGVGFPATEELDGVTIDVSTEESSRAARTQGPGGHQHRVDASEVADSRCCVTQGVGDVDWFCVVPAAVCRVVMSADPRFWRRIVAAKQEG